MLRSIDWRAFRSLGPSIALALGCAACLDEGGFDLYIPYVPTPEHIVERMLELAEVGANDFVIDLGSGDGRIAIAAARKHGARALGVDIEPNLVRLADENAAKAGVTDKVTFREQDLFDTKIADATVITLYLPTGVNIKLRPRFLEELRPGTRIVSHAFNMGGWLADTHESIRGIDVYLWIVPARVAGRWELRDGERRYMISIEQQFQEIRGTAAIDGRSLQLLDAKLRGTQIDFTVDHGDGNRKDFRGLALRGRINPRNAAGAAEETWRMTRAATQPAPN